MPHSLGLFLCTSILSNLDHVLWRAKDYGLQDTTINNVPWIIWYIWKVRNDKPFNGKDTSPLETIQIAKSEAESWSVAQTIEDSHDDDDDGAAPFTTTTTTHAGPVCSIDASWHKDDNFFGGGMVLATEDGMTTSSSFISNQVLTSLHAEFQALLWTMKSSIQLDHSSMTFETDCLQLVNLLEEDN
ncbi:hypothetical protein YC2023_005124 [Brassica napus]